jgi:hypothetical protein
LADIKGGMHHPHGNVGEVARIEDFALLVDPLLDAAGEHVDALLEFWMGVEVMPLADCELGLDDREVLGLGLAWAAEPAVDAPIEGLGDGLGGLNETVGHGAIILPKQKTKNEK